MATLNGLNVHFGRETVWLGSRVLLESAGVPPPWLGKAEWQLREFTKQLEELLAAS
jgi:hypothetical protein